MNKTENIINEVNIITAELDALKPDILIDIVDKSIKNEIDVDLLDQEYQIYAKEVNEIKSYRKEIYNYFAINE